MSGSHIAVVLTNTKDDVERHRVCDKHIIRWRSHHPQWPWWTFQQAGYCPSSSWSRRTNPKRWESDTTLTAYLPLSGCRIVQRNRCLPYHPVVGTTSGTSDIWQHLVECQINGNIGRMSLRCTSLRWWTNSQLRPDAWPFAYTKFVVRGKSARSNCLRLWYHDSVRQLQESVMTTTDLTHRRSWYVSQ
jgi:hypothetical protein